MKIKTTKAFTSEVKGKVAPGKAFTVGDGTKDTVAHGLAQRWIARGLAEDVGDKAPATTAGAAK